MIMIVYHKNKKSCKPALFVHKCLNEHPQPLPKPKPLPPQQQRSKRMMMMQLQSPPKRPLLPHPLPQLPPPFPHPPQRRSIRMIQIQLLPPLSHPHPLLHPPPQFVAVKSLMLEPPKFVYNVYYERELALFPKDYKNLYL